MNRKLISEDYFSFGLVLSLGCHFLSTFFFAPIIKTTPEVSVRGKTEFIGSMLSQSDISSLVLTGKSSRRTPDQSLDLKRRPYFEKIPSSSSKPEVKFRDIVFFQKPESVLQVGVPVAGARQKIAFGFSDYQKYIYGVDLSDIEKIVKNGELGGYIDFKVLLGVHGEVLEIKKISGCGDPALDLDVMLRLKQSIFRSGFTSEPIWVTFRFKLR